LEETTSHSDLSVKFYSEEVAACNELVPVQICQWPFNLKRWLYLMVCTHKVTWMSTNRQNNIGM